MITTPTVKSHGPITSVYKKTLTTQWDPQIHKRRLWLWAFNFVYNTSTESIDTAISEKVKHIKICPTMSSTSKTVKLSQY